MNDIETGSFELADDTIANESQSDLSDDRHPTPFAIANIDLEPHHSKSSFPDLGFPIENTTDNNHLKPDESPIAA